MARGAASGGRCARGRGHRRHLGRSLRRASRAFRTRTRRGARSGRRRSTQEGRRRGAGRDRHRGRHGEVAARASRRSRRPPVCDRVARGCPAGGGASGPTAPTESEGVELMKTTVIGAYPKISDEQQDLRRALHRHDRGELDGDGLSAVLDESTRWAIGELNWAGIDVINDGQIRWDDLLAPFAIARAAIERLAAAGVPLALQTYFFPADPLLDALAAFPIAQVGFDVRSRNTHVLEKLTGLRQTVVLGVVDARNTRVETERELVGLIEKALKRIPAEYLWLAPTTGLEYLPHDVAVQKLKVLVSAAHAIGGVKA